MVATAPAAASRLSENIMQFARALRAAGLPVGPGKAIDAIEAVKAVGIGDRDDFYWTLHAVFVQRREQREIFDQAFHIFWRNPQFLQRMMALMLPSFRGEELDETHQEISPRVAEIFHEGRIPGVVVTKELHELCARHGQSPDRGASHRDRAQARAGRGGVRAHAAARLRQCDDRWGRWHPRMSELRAL